MVEWVLVWDMLIVAGDGCSEQWLEWVMVWSVMVGMGDSYGP